jgi:predicted phosphohydrolase
MTRLAWMTDIHLEFLKPWDLEPFFETVRSQSPDGVIVTGDIAQSAMLRSVLLQMVKTVAVPVYFVLGNHDYYGSDIPIVRKAMKKLTQEELGPVWLPEAGVIELSPEVALVGHDGWSDGRYGHFFLSPIILNDYLMIESLRTSSEQERFERLNALGDEAAVYLRGVLDKAAQRVKRVFVAMHPPPFMQACWHGGKIPDEYDVYLPHFSCKAVGDVLLEITGQYPNVDFTVLCGHTHGGGTAQISDNLLVLTGAAEYGEPVVQQVFEF